MTAGIYELLKLQNKILDDAITAYSQQRRIDRKYIIDTY
jgi:hypothetical protein